jgi:peptidyl-prolyl cis-trans isomerase SurA
MGTAREVRHDRAEGERVSPTRLPGPTRLAGVAGLALAAVLLSGCGSTPGWNAGIAARVDGHTVSMDRVDQVTDTYCGAVEGQLEGDQALPLHYLRGQVASSLALRLAADQFAAEQGVDPDAEYAQALEQAEPQLAALSEEARQAVIDVDGASIYVGAVEKAAGRKILQERGRPTASEDAVRKAGARAFGKWLADQDVRLDPRFGVTIDGGRTAATDTSLSYALGKTATDADADQPDTTYAAGLPGNQRCG